MGDSKGARQSKELNRPYISNLPSDSSAGLVGEKLRLGITRPKRWRTSETLP